MATLNVYWYGDGLRAFHEGEVDWESDTIKVALLTGDYSPDQGGDTDFAAIDEHEAEGDGYDAGGEELTGRTLTYDAGNLRVTLDGDDLSWDPSSITAQYAVLYRESDGQLIGYGDAGEEQTSEDAAWEITWNEDGILRTTADAA